MSLDASQQARVDLLRPLVGDWDDNDQGLYDLLQVNGDDLDAAAAAAWRQKASAAASWVDVQEGSSKRPLSQLAPLARGMAEYYQSRADAGSTVTDGRSRVRPITRAS